MIITQEADRHDVGAVDLHPDPYAAGRGAGRGSGKGGGGEAGPSMGF